MATPEQNKLLEMYRNIPAISENYANNIAELEETRDDLNDQASAIEDAVLAVAEASAVVFITNIILPLYPGGYIVYGPNFGTIDYDDGGITDWAIYEDIITPNPTPPPPFITTPTIVYSYTPGDYPDLDELVGDYAYGNEYLTKPLDADGTYGIYANITNSEVAIDLLTANKTLIDAGEDVFSRYIP